MKSVSRLVKIFTPDHYDLSLTLHRVARTFEGTVTINGTARVQGEIRVHSKDLIINGATVDGKEATFHEESNDELVISHPDIASGVHIVVIGFSGTITDDMNGIYPCYFEVEGEKQELLATQFESHYARKAFPCIDEPEAKATFDVTLTTEDNITVLGNMPVASQKKDGDLLVKRVHRKVDGTISLISENTRYPPEEISPALLDKLHIVGRVRWVGRAI